MTTNKKKVLESLKEKIDIDRDGFHETMKILSQKYKFHYQRKVRNGD